MWFRIFIAIFSVLGTFSLALDSPSGSSSQPDFCKVQVIAHRGASGYLPEHTLAAYAVAILMGADYIEPDLVMTKDKHLITRHDTVLDETTDVSKRPEFASRRRDNTVDGIQVTGWFTEDLTLEEIKSLRAVERIPHVRPGNARMDGTFEIPTFQEVIDLVKSLQLSEKRTIGLYPEIKHSTHYQRLDLPMERLLVDTLFNNGYSKSTDPVYIQSFEINNLKNLRNMTELKLMQLYRENKSMQPFDQAQLRSSLTYGDMATLDGLREVAKYANAVGPDKSYIIRHDKINNKLGEATSFVREAHAVGLKVHPWTFRAENSFLSTEFRNNGSLGDFGDFEKELRTYLATGIDGLFTENPDKVVRIRGPC